MYEFLEYRASDVMTRDPIGIEESASLSELEALFDKHGFNGLPVSRENGELGWVTKLDLLRAFQFDERHLFPPYNEIMRQTVSTILVPMSHSVTPRTALTRVLEKLVASGHKSLPVVEDGAVVGIVAREDLLKALRGAVDGRRPWLDSTSRS